MSAAQTLTTKQLQTVFGVAHMTIYNWRQGTATKEPLPFETVGEKGAIKPRVHYKLSDVKRWAKANGVPFKVEPDKVLAGKVPKERKRVAH